MARPEGVEPPTNSLEGCCSIQLSYGRVMLDHSHLEQPSMARDTVPDILVRSLAAREAVLRVHRAASPTELRALERPANYSGALPSDLPQYVLFHA
jgi:hypothetical protein